jgi:hypothetical protein
MKILASFCNVRIPGRPTLALLDTVTFSCHAVKLTNDIRRGISATGLAVSADNLYVAIPGGSPTDKSELIILDRHRLEVCNRYRFRYVQDIHSILLDRTRMYAVSTGTDQIVELQIRGSEIVSEHPFWRPDPRGPLRDLHHLNSLCQLNGDLLVSGFGDKTENTWSHSGNGFVFNITRDRSVISGIHHPHSVIAFDKHLALCESKKGVLHVLGRGRVQKLPGYVRGLCRLGDRLFVGTSIGRRASRTSSVINSPNARGIAAGECTLTAVDLHGLEIARIVDMGGLGEEIYELMVIDRTEQWQLSIETGPVCTWDALVENTFQELATLVSPQSPFVLVDQDVFRPDIPTHLAAFPFLEKNEKYWGLPADDSIAIRELARLRARGASHIVFTWPAFWWLDHYAELHSYLRSEFECVRENERLIAFDLSSGGRGFRE